MIRSPRMLPLLALGALVLVAGCDSASPSTGAEARAAAAAAAPSPAGTRFDGRYSGPAVLTMNRGTSCGAQSQTRSITVVNGHATYVVDQTRNMVMTGPVAVDGTVTMTSQAESGNLAGRFASGGFSGEYRGRECGRSLELRRARA